MHDSAPGRRIQLSAEVTGASARALDVVTLAAARNTANVSRVDARESATTGCSLYRGLERSSRGMEKRRGGLGGGQATPQRSLVLCGYRADAEVCEITCSTSHGRAATNAHADNLAITLEGCSSITRRDPEDSPKLTRRSRADAPAFASGHPRRGLGALPCDADANAASRNARVASRRSQHAAMEDAQSRPKLGPPPPFSLSERGPEEIP